MPVVFALMFLAPLVAMIAVANGAIQVLPIMMGMSAIAVVAHIFFEKRRKKA